MSEHTPGPWKVVDCTLYNVKCFEVQHGDIGESVCMTDNAEPNQEADAHLIAAAPDLLEALKNLENDGGQMPDTAWALVQAAIAKATP